MSHFCSITTKFKDKQCLIDALKTLGLPERFKRQITAEMLEVHDEPQPLYGYQGDIRQEKAHIILRRKHINWAANDIGFVKLSDGTYQAIISENELRHQGFDAAWLGRLTQEYGVLKSVKQLKQKGMRVQVKRQEDGRVRVVAQGR